MHHQRIDRRSLLAILAFFITMCLLFITQTPRALAMFAGSLVIAGILGWLESRELPSPWIVRLVSTAVMALGIGFLIWYFRVGRTLLRPIVDLQGIFESTLESSVTPTPEG